MRPWPHPDPKPQAHQPLAAVVFEDSLDERAAHRLRVARLMLISRLQLSLLGRNLRLQQMQRPVSGPESHVIGLGEREVHCSEENGRVRTESSSRVHWRTECIPLPATAGVVETLSLGLCL